MCFRRLSGATAAGGNAGFLCLVGKRAPRSAKIWKMNSAVAMVLRKKLLVWSYCICREEVLRLDTEKVVRDPWISVLEGLCCGGDCLPHGFRQSKAVLEAGDNSHLCAAVESKPNFSRL